MNFRRIIFIIVVILIILALIAGIHWLFWGRKAVTLPGNAPGTTLSGSAPVSIILSADFGDAALSLGGFLAQHTRPALVATFFSGQPNVATTTALDQAAGFTDSSVANNVRILENQRALSALGAVPENYGCVPAQYGFQENGQPLDIGTLGSEIAEDIQALLVANAGRQVYVYGPADFGPGITNPDDQVLHDAFTDTVTGFPGSNVHFFYYETYPAVAAFAESGSVALVQNFLENESGLFLTTTQISLSGGQVAAKISAVKQYQSLVQAYQNAGQDIATEDQQYTSTRCAGQACEMVYSIATSTAL